MQKMDCAEKRAYVRRLLKRWGSATNICRSKQAQIAEYNGLLDAVTDIRPARLTGMPRGSGVSDSTVITAQQREKLRALYQVQIDDILSEVAELLDFVRCLDDLVRELSTDEQRILDLRYRRFWRKDGWCKVARVMSMSERTARRTETSAVDKLTDKISVDRL